MEFSHISIVSHKIYKQRGREIINQRNIFELVERNSLLKKKTIVQIFLMLSKLINR